MLKFFRNIRRRLLDSGSLRKPASPLGRYLVYAIGEILLVVIGILIALQINNWNNYRNNRKAEKEYINRLINELNSDMKYYKFIRERFIEKREGLENIITIWQSDNPILKDSLQYINDYKQSGQISIWYNEPITWTQMVQTGDLKLIEDQELIDSLFIHYNFVKKAAENYSLHPMDITNKARETMHLPFINQNLDSYWSEKPNNEVYALIWENKEQYLPLYYKIALVSDIQTNTMGDIIKSGEALIEKLKLKD